MNKQEQWRKRAWLKAKIHSNFLVQADIVTLEEQCILDQIRALQTKLLLEFKENSIKLGFKAKDRCSYFNCNNIQTLDSKYCKKHKHIEYE